MVVCQKENAQKIQGQLSKLKMVSKLKQTTNKSLKELLVWQGGFHGYVQGNEPKELICNEAEAEEYAQEIMMKKASRMEGSNNFIQIKYNYNR
jgi:hypothetical protein